MKHSLKIWFIVFTVLVLIIVTVGLLLGKAKKDDTTLTPITFNLTYIPNIQFAPIYVAIDQGFFADEGLDVRLFYGNEADLVALVGSGNQSFMIASGEQVLLSRAQGVPVVYVAEWYQDYPVGVVSLVEKGILEPGDLKGKTIGIPGLDGASYIGFEALRYYAQLSDTDLKLNSIGFAQVEALVAGQADAAVIYVANEPTILRSKGYDVNLIRVSDYLELIGNGLVTNEMMIKSNPGMVQSMVNALIKGILFTYDNPEKAYEISKAFVENLAAEDNAVQMEILTASMDLWQIEQPGVSSESGWANMQQLLLDIGMLSAPIELEKAYTNDFVR
jgi:NitT/TauT family transport system substrate-binding protein